MARHAPVQSIYEATERWKNSCLLGEGSLFVRTSLWNAKNFGSLDTYYARNLDEGEGDFFTKLKGQLGPAPAEAKQLAAEVLLVMYLFLSNESMSPPTKRRQIRMVWEWSGTSFPEDTPLLDAPLEGGIGHPGTAFFTHRWRELLWFVVAMVQWYGLPGAERESLLADPWKMAEWIESTPEASGRQLRHILLHLLFPDTFERMSTATHKRRLVTALADKAGISAAEIDSKDRIKLDRQIVDIREAMRTEYGDDFDFYSQAVREQWDPRDGGARVEADGSGERDQSALRSWYRDRFGNAQVWAIGPGQGGQLWPEFHDEGIIAIGWDFLGDLLDYSTREEIEQSLQTHHGDGTRKSNDSLACYEFAHVMQEGDVVIAKKGRSGLYGYGVVRSGYRFDETREQYLHVRDVEWQKTGDWDLPPDQWVAVKTLTNFTENPEWLRLAFGIMAGERQAQEEEDPDEVPVYGRKEALADLFVPPEQFDEMQQALLRTKALILTGAPGVGKTFVSRRLAWSVMRRRDPKRVRLVQFHQSYAYEDFVQGWRPTESGGFTLRDGVFYTFCREARKDEENQYVFIIDEINRANLSKVFGELLMLIEADKRSPDYAVRLAYASEHDEPFYVPENVYIIGLMNTADRSLALVDYALRRRFSFINLRPAFGGEAFYQHLIGSGAEATLVDQIVDRMTALNAAIAADTANLGPGFEIGHSYFVPRKEDSTLDRDWFERVVEHEIKPLLNEYWFDQPQKVEEEVRKLLA